MPMVRNEWSKEDIDYLRKYYKTYGARKCSKRLGRSAGAIRQYANRHDIRGSVFLTKKERNYFKERYGTVPTEYLAKKFGTSEEAIRARARYYGVSFIDNNEKLCVSEVLQIMGVNRKTFNKWNVPCEKIGRLIFVDFDDLVEWMKGNQDKWNAMTVEQIYFRGMEWFQIKRGADLEEMKEQQRKSKGY